MTNASTLSRLWRSTNFTANPPAKWRTTRPMAFPTARTVAISGTVSAEIAAPETDNIDNETCHGGAVMQHSPA